MRAEKNSIIEEIRSKISDAVFVILADYRGLSVAKTEDLKNRLRGVDAHFQVVQNRMFKRVAKELQYSGFEEKMQGPSAMVFGNGDVVQAAKILKDFIKENELPLLKVGTMQGVILSRSDIEQLASLPSRETLLAQFVGLLAAPMSQLVGVLQQKVASLVYVLKAAQEKKEQV
jgi:large subunit ribosomal protein L10